MKGLLLGFLLLVAAAAPAASQCTNTNTFWTSGTILSAFQPQICNAAVRTSSHSIACQGSSHADRVGVLTLVTVHMTSRQC